MLISFLRVVRTVLQLLNTSTYSLASSASTTSSKMTSNLHGKLDKKQSDFVFQ